MPDNEQLENWLNKRRERRKHLTAEELFPKIQAGSREALSAAITLLESKRKEDASEAQQLILKSLPFQNRSWRIGITGVPGVGKSTFIEAFGKEIISRGLKLAVLAIDPSSNVTGGSILGDKTRMNWLSTQENVFIRPSAAGDSLGGVNRTTRETIALCEAAGFDVIFIETVGVGQSETLVHSMVDFFLLLMLSGAGDELQGIKRGIMEMADAIVITKADGSNVDKSKLARAQYANALHLFPAKQSQWIPTAKICSSLENTGLDEVWNLMESYFRQIQSNGWYDENRKRQAIKVLHSHLQTLLFQQFLETEKAKNLIALKEQAVLKGEISAYQASEEIFQALFLNV